MKTFLKLEIRSTLAAVGFVALLASPVVRAASGDWAIDGLGIWSEATNWFPVAIPGVAADDVVGLTFDITAARTVTIDTTNRTVGVLNIGDTNSTFFPYTLAASGGARLAFDTTGGNAQLNKSTAENTAADLISTPLVLNTNLDIANSSTATGTITISGSIFAGNAGTKTLANVGAGTADVTISGVISNGSGTMAMLQNSSGSTLTLSGSNTFSGAATVNSGVLKLQGPAFSASNRVYSIASGAVLNLDGNTIVATNMTIINGAGTLRITGGQLSNIGPGRNIAMSMTAGGLIDVQSGASLLNGGWQNINWTTNKASLTVNGSFDVWDGLTVNVDALNGSGTIDKGIGSGATTVILNVGVTNGSGVFSGPIKNTQTFLALTKSGTGAQTLAGTNSYTGATTVNDGTLTLTGNRTVAGGAVSVGNGGTSTLNIQGDLPFAGNNQMFVGSTTTGIVNHSAGTVTFNAGNTGELLIGNGGNGTYILSGSGVLNIGASANRGIMLGVNNGSAGNPKVAAFTMSGGTINNASVLMIPRDDSATSFFNSSYTQTAGISSNQTLTVGGNAANGANSTAALSLTGGTFVATTFSRLSAGTNVTSTITIAGTADVTLGAFPATRGAGSTASIIFDGGTLRSAAASATYMGGLTSAKIRAGGATFDVASGRDITVTQSLATDLLSTGGGLTKAGSGTLTLAGTNTYDGPTTVNANGGTLQIGSTGQLGSGSYTGAISIGSSATVRFSSSAAQTLSGIISGAGSLTKDTSSSSALTLSGANTYTGATTVTSGMLNVNSPGSLDAGSAVVVASGATLGGDGTISGLVQIAKSGSLYAGPSSGVIGTLTVANSSTNALTLNEGNLTVDLPSSGTNCDLVAITGGLVLNGVNTVVINAPNGAAPGTYTLMSYSAVSGSGSVVFANGMTNVGNATLSVDAGAVTITIGAGGLSNSVWKGSVSSQWDGGTLNWTRNGVTSQAFADGDLVTFDNSASTTTVTSAADVSPAFVNVNSTSNYTISARIVGAGTSLVKSGPGTLTLSTNTYGGGTVINGGTVAFNPSGLVNPLGSGMTRVNPGTTLALNASTLTNPVTLNGALVTAGNSFGSSMNGPVTLESNSTISISGNLSIGGDISGAGGLTKTLAANVPVTGTNTYTGPTVVTGGALKFKKSLYGNDTTQWIPANITVGSGAALIINVGGSGEFSIGQFVTLFTNLVTGVNSNGLQAGSIIGLDTSGAGASATNTISINLSDSTGAGGGAVGIKLFGAGTLELAGTNTYTGLSIADNNGTLRVSSINSVSNNPGLGTVHASSSSLGAPTNVVSGTIWLGTGAPTYQGGNLTYTGTGETTDRIINMGGANGTSYTFDQSGTGLLKFISAFTITDNRGAKTITLRGSTAGMGEIASVIPLGQSTNAPNHLTKSGTGTWTLSAANANTGGVFTVTGGSLVLSNSIAIPGGIGVAGGLSALTFNGGVLGLGAGDFTRSLAAAGTITAANFTGNGGWAAYGADRAVNLGGASALITWATANTGFNAKTLILGNVTATHTLDFQNPLDLGAAARTVQVDDGAAATDAKLSGSITGSAGGNLTKTGGGTLELTGTNTYIGATTVSNGTLLVNGELAAASNVKVVSGTLGGVGVIGGSVTNAATCAPGSASAGTLTVGGNYVQTSAGSLNIEIGGTTNFDVLVVGNTATLAGTLNVTLTNGYTGVAGNTFTVLTATTVSGVFTTTNLPALGGGTGWKVDYQSSAVVLSITNATPPATGYDLYATGITNGATSYQGDGDGDGYANLLEYVTGGDANNADTVARMNGTRVGGLLALQFTRTSNSVDTTIIVEGSGATTNDANWIGIATNIGGSWGSATNVIETNGPAIFNVTAYDTNPATNRFLRLRVTRP